MDITILIATKNKNYFLSRALNYYSALKFTGNIIIIDSSENLELEKNKITISELKDLKIFHKIFKGHIFQALAAGSLDIKTNFAICSGDDDYLIPSGLKKCIDILEKKENYTAIHGDSILVSLKEDNLSSIEDVTYKFQPTCEQGTAANRLKKLFSRYGTSNFSVQRTKDFCRSFRCFDLNVKEKINPLHEILNTSLSTAYGKIGYIKGLSAVRIGHSQRNKLPDTKTLTEAENFSSISNFFVEYLSKEISMKDNITEEASKNLVRIMFDKYIKRKIKKKKSAKLIIILFLKKVLTVLGLFNIVKRFVNIFLPYNLNQLLKNNSPFSESFLPVYESITKFKLKK